MEKQAFPGVFYAPDSLYIFFQFLDIPAFQREVHYNILGFEPYLQRKFRMGQYLKTRSLQIYVPSMRSFICKKFYSAIKKNEIVFFLEKNGFNLDHCMK